VEYSRHTMMKSALSAFVMTQRLCDLDRTAFGFLCNKNQGVQETYKCPLGKQLSTTVKRIISLIFCVAPSFLIAQTPVDVWTLQADIAPGSRYLGETVANGMLGVVSTSDPFSTAGVMMQGVYDRNRENNVDVILRAFNVVHMSLAIDSDGITHAQQVSHLHQALNLKNGTLTTTFNYQDKASVRYSWYALRQLPYTALVDVTITAKQPVDITATVNPEAPPGAEGLLYTERHFQDGHTPSEPLAIVTATAHSPSGNLLLAASHAFLFDKVVENSSVRDIVTAEGVHAITFTKHLEAGVAYHFAAVGSTITSAQNTNPRNEAERLTILATLMGREELIAQHERAWEQLWHSDVVIEGDQQTQRDIHAMLYHLYAFTREGGAVALSPMGLSGTGYNGHVFWDTETWMYPVLLSLHPEIAKSLLEYRYERLGAARQNAIANGYRGAMFPWESSASGNEDTPLCCLTGIMEHHVTADVGIAAWNYYRVTQDREWLRTRGYPLLEGTADFWTSRVSQNEPGHYDIEHVAGADEYALDVNNDAFTNAAARENLAAAIAAARVLGLSPHPEWEEVSKGIRILKYPDGVTREHATYQGEMIKQADVNLLAYPLNEITDPEAIRHDLEYYSPRVDPVNGPAMTKSVLAILYERLGMPENAYRLFKSSYTPNERPPFGVIAETPSSNNPYFATGVGGSLQTMLYGFGGLELTDQGFSQRHTQLPATWKSLTLTGIGPRHESFTVK
jgi:protein-glucosylgalactosylhydroxylysine glucosidase